VVIVGKAVQQDECGVLTALFDDVELPTV